MADPHFSPARLAPILGVSESTLKRWVDAGHLRAVVSPGGHRRIALGDLLAFLRKRGRAVPSLAGLGLLAEHAAAPAAPDAIAPAALADLLLRGDTDVARTVLLGHFRRGHAIEDLLDRVVAPAMVHVGALWADGTIDVYQEHVATLHVWRILMELRGLLAPPAARAPVALGGAPEGDPYLLPCLMAEMVLAELGWRVVNTGPNTPLASLRDALDAHRPRLVWLSLTSRDLPPVFVKEYRQLFAAAEARGARVALGGQGLTPEVQDRVVASAFGTRLAHLKAFAQTLGPVASGR